LHFLHDQDALKYHFALQMHLHYGVFFLVSMLLFSSPLFGQIKVGLELEQRDFVVGEAFVARVNITSELDVPLVFGDDFMNGELFVELVRDQTAGLSTADRKPISREMVVMPGNTKVELVELTSLFNLTKPGGHRIRVGVRYEDYVYFSSALGFDLVQGIELLSARRSLAGYHDVNLEYSLRYWRRSAGEQAFFVIRDLADGSIYGTFRLGPIVRVNPPALKFDKDGRAIVVHQSGRNRFTRSVLDVDSNGARLVGQKHLLEDGRPYPIRNPARINRVVADKKGQDKE
jgi:hypothetical protein